MTRQHHGAKISVRYLGSSIASSLPPLGPCFGAYFRGQRRAAVDGEADGHEQFLLSRRRAQAEHTGRLAGRIPERMRGVGRDVYGRPSADGLRPAAEGEFEFAVQKREHLLEIVAMRRRPAAVRHQHVDEAIASGRLGPRQKNRVCAAGDRDVPQSGAVRVGDRQSTVGVVVACEES
jgi:hypothetical protein